MNKLRLVSGTTNHDDLIAGEIASSPVVVFCSNVTDTRVISNRLDAQGVPYRLVIMGMGSASMRERFHRLQNVTGWTTLPQIFVEGRFIGGYEEFLAFDFSALVNGGRAPSAAKWFGYGGLAPFVSLAAAILFAPQTVQPIAIAALLAYGAIILSFLGAVHWGVALREPAFEPLGRALGLSVAPAIVGWVALLLPTLPALATLSAGLIAMYVVDRTRLRRLTVPAWYLRLRMPLTAGAVCSLLVAVIAVVIAAIDTSVESNALVAGVNFVSF